jgi:hypothetical protein
MCTQQKRILRSVRVNISVYGRKIAWIEAMIVES